MIESEEPTKATPPKLYGVGVGSPAVGAHSPRRRQRGGPGAEMDVYIAIGIGKQSFVPQFEHRGADIAILRAELDLTLTAI